MMIAGSGITASIEQLCTLRDICSDLSHQCYYFLPALITYLNKLHFLTNINIVKQKITLLHYH